MRKVPRLILSVVFCALVFIFAALIFQVRRSTEAVKQTPTITFKNQTTSIQISEIKQTDQYVKLIVTNIAALPLATLYFGIEGGKTNADYINVDFTTDENLNGQLDPGKSESFHLGVRPLPAPGETKVTLKMAFFIDGSAEGDPELVNRQRDIFSAMDSVYQLANIEIGKISTFDPVALENAKSKIENLTLPANITSAQEMGFKIGKGRAALLIDRLSTDASELSNEKKEERLATLKNKFSKALPGVNRREK